MGFATVTGTFASSEGQITIPESGIAGMSATATVAVESISTNNDDRDGHLKSPDFFDAANHPTLTLVTKSITPTGPNTFDLVADLTMRGTTKEVTLAGEYFGTVVDPWGNQKIALSATGMVDRFDYGLSWNKLIETGELVVSREVELDLQVQAALVTDQGAE
jgi:polyisoprenoid-binding protein YceI